MMMLVVQHVIRTDRSSEIACSKRLSTGPGLSIDDDDKQAALLHTIKDTSPHPR